MLGETIDTRITRQSQNLDFPDIELETTIDSVVMSISIMYHILNAILNISNFYDMQWYFTAAFINTCMRK